MTTARTIKRYANRKLYDTRDSRYVTLDHIAAMVRAGDDVRVVEPPRGDAQTFERLRRFAFAQRRLERRERVGPSAPPQRVLGGGERVWRRHHGRSCSSL